MERVIDLVRIFRTQLSKIYNFKTLLNKMINQKITFLTGEHFQIEEEFANQIYRIVITQKDPDYYIVFKINIVLEQLFITIENLQTALNIQGLKDIIHMMLSWELVSCVTPELTIQYNKREETLTLNDQEIKIRFHDEDATVIYCQFPFTLK